jgi:hypothetical protein
MKTTPYPFVRSFNINEVPHYKCLRPFLAAQAALNLLTHESRDTDGVFGVDEIDRALPRGERELPLAKLIELGFIEVVDTERWRIVRFEAEQWTKKDREDAAAAARAAANIRHYGTANPPPPKAAPKRQSSRPAASKGAPRVVRSSDNPAENVVHMRRALPGAMQDQDQDPVNSEPFGLFVPSTLVGRPPPPPKGGGADPTPAQHDVLKPSDLEERASEVRRGSPARPGVGLGGHPQTASGQDGWAEQTGEWPVMTPSEATRLVTMLDCDLDAATEDVAAAEDGSLWSTFLQEDPPAPASFSVDRFVDEEAPPTLPSERLTPAVAGPPQAPEPRGGATPAGPLADAPAGDLVALREACPWATMLEAVETPEERAERLARAAALQRWKEGERERERLLREDPEMRALAELQDQVRLAAIKRDADALERRRQQEQAKETGS